MISIWTYDPKTGKDLYLVDEIIIASLWRRAFDYGWQIDFQDHRIDGKTVKYDDAKFIIETIVGYIVTGSVHAS